MNILVTANRVYVDGEYLNLEEIEARASTREPAGHGKHFADVAKDRKRLALKDVPVLLAVIRELVK